MARLCSQIVVVALAGLMALSALSGCYAERMMERAGGTVEAFATKGLDKINPDSIFANAMIDATNPETEGDARVYQAWGVQWRNRYNGIIARGNVHMAGKGGASDDPQLRELIREKLGDPWLKQLDRIVEDYRKLKGDGAAPKSAAPDPAGPGAADVAAEPAPQSAP